MLKLHVRVGQSIAIGGPTTLRIEHKSGQEIGLVFDADRSVPIRIVPESDAPEPRGAPLGLDGSTPADPADSGINPRRMTGRK
jgi:hypothetical protein